MTIWGPAFLCLVTVGTVIAGLFPVNANPTPHVVGAILGMLGGQVALILLGIAVWRSRRRVGFFSLVLGIVGLFGFSSHRLSAFPTGTAEGIAGYPGVVWMIVLGAVLLWHAARLRRPPSLGH